MSKLSLGIKNEGSKKILTDKNEGRSTKYDL